MTISLSDIGGQQKQLQVITSAVSAKSAFQAASKQQPITIGVDNHLLTGANVNLELVGEGEKKPVGGSITSLVMSPKKIAGFLTATEETYEHVDIDSMIEASVPGDIARKFDGELVDGTLGNLDDVSSVPLEEWRDLHGILGSVNASAFVMSSAFAARVQGWRNGAGVEYMSQQAALTNLLGVPVHIFRSSTPTAYVGDFEGQSRWGLAVPRGGLVKFYDEATLTIDGVETNLADTNLVAWRVEAYFAFGVNPSAFRKVELAEGAGL